MLKLHSTTGQHQKVPIEGVSLLSILHMVMPWLLIVRTERVSEPDILKLKGFLSEVEIAKSERFHYQKDRQSYIIVHGLIRWISGNLLGMEPKAIRIDYNAYGKPFIPNNTGNIFFNVSHSSGASVLAFDQGHEIGADIEKIDPDFDFQPIIQRFFTEKENRFINEPGKQSSHRFYKLWTRKEAFLKALAIGITENLDVEVFRRRNYLDLKDKRNDGIRSNDFLLKTMSFRNEYILSIASKSVPGKINAYLLEEGFPTDPEPDKVEYD